MNYERHASCHVWCMSSGRFTLACFVVGVLAALVALGSLEFVGVECDRAEDRCEVTNLTLFGGRTTRTFAPSRAVGFSSNIEQRTWSSRGSRQTSFTERPEIRLEGGEVFAFRVTSSTNKVKTTIWGELYGFFELGEGESVARRDVFSGWGLPLGWLTAALMALACVLGSRSARLEVDLEARQLRLRRRGVFAPARYEGGLDEIESCVLQPDASASSPGIFLSTREGEWLVLDLHTASIGSEAFVALEQVLTQAGVPVVQAEQGRWPRIDYSTFPITVGVLGAIVFVATLAPTIIGFALVW